MLTGGRSGAAIFEAREGAATLSTSIALTSALAAVGTGYAGMLRLLARLVRAVMAAATASDRASEDRRAILTALSFHPDMVP